MIEKWFFGHFLAETEKSLLAFIALWAAQSSAQTRIHNAILVIDTSKFIG